ncbi:HAMP domain-containing sensor histidine kinase [Gracilibacillus sp. S3-1-1]|uniref:HAMP domain-containing sensor histidine kinase n=1 Tax=Gracilibacillus pellucidus TaxID=3095368 RepID=A0ACC6M8X1_9BACI|nr:HAMP domain-containing sensor histidine kinase [Gracilibacillus sp. S3-1-1]MDX8047297.1 HAMP domain-containing sensor histidine kinase [Gracilibacillus sp. S3-1-1]
MKIRTWLIISYLIVMLLPLAAAYGFFILVQEWNQSKELTDTFELYERIESIEEALQSPTLYQYSSNSDVGEQLSREVEAPDINITLYRHDGLLIYQTDAEKLTLDPVDRPNLFKSLYQYDLSYDSLTVKKPVYQDDQIVGIYEVSVDRSEWVDGVQNRRNIMVIVLFSLFLMVYIVVIVIVNRKLNRPLNKLMKGMSLFSSTQKPIYFQDKKKDEIGQLMEHFEQMQEEIKAAQLQTKQEQEEKQLMMASFSHDIKTPLTSLQAYAEALQDENSLTNEERKEYLQIMKNKSTHIKGMIEDLTLYAKLQSAQYDMELANVDAEEFFDMLFEGYDELARKHHVYLRKTNEIAGTCYMNDQQMVRYLDNLMSNALRFTPQGGMIGIAAVGTAQDLPDWVFSEAKEDINQFREDRGILIVQNEGPGIQDKESIFMPFFQGEEARTSDKTKNTGLGLNIAKRIAEKHQGEMKLWSLEHRGIVIVMTFQIEKGME